MKKLGLLFLLFSSIAFSQNKTEVDLSSPNATIYTHLYFLQSDSYNPKKASETIYGFKGKLAEQKAIKLKEILDGKGLRVDFNKVPKNPNYIDTLHSNFNNKHVYLLFPERMPQIYVEKIGDKWYYSKSTISTINKLYKEVFPWQTTWLKNKIPAAGHKKIFTIQLWQYVGLLILIALNIILFFLLKKIIFFILRKLQFSVIHFSNNKINNALKKLSRPLVLLLLISFNEKILPSIQLSLTINTFLFLALNIAQTIFWIYVFLKLVQVVMSIYAEITQKTKSKLDDQLVPILKNFLNGIVIFLGILKLLTLFGVNVTTVLAGASIGGLAIALASQDTVKNLIGTFMIFLDKPFHIGDWIEAASVAGTVEEVGFRSTRIRAADTSIYQMPNSTLAEIVVNNKGLRLFRRYKTELGIRYDTPPELIEAFVKGIRELIVAHPETRSEAYNVEFTGFGDSALLIMVNVYFKVLDWSSEQASKHKLHIAIVKLAKGLGVDFAFPSTTVMIEQFPDKSTYNMQYNLNKTKIDKTINKVLKEFKEQNLEIDSGSFTVSDDDNDK